MLADQLEDNAFYGVSVLAMSSASSKTAYGAAFLLQGQGAEMVGLTSPGNVAFTESLGCYDQVVAYDSLPDLDATKPTVYLDVAGSADLRARLRDRLGDRLVKDVVIGVTHQEQGGEGGLAASGTEFFFAPNQMRKRTGDWGRPELDRRFAEAWLRFAPTAEKWVDVVRHEGRGGAPRRLARSAVGDDVAARRPRDRAVALRQSGGGDRGARSRGLMSPTALPSGSVTTRSERP